MEERSAFPPPGPSTSQLPAHQVERRLSHREEIKYCFKSKRLFSMVRKETDDGPWDSVNDFYLLMTMMGKGHGNKTLISAKGVKRPLKSAGGCFVPENASTSHDNSGYVSMEQAPELIIIIHGNWENYIFFLHSMSPSILFLS